MRMLKMIRDKLKKLSMKANIQNIKIKERITVTAMPFINQLAFRKVNRIFH